MMEDALNDLLRRLSGERFREISIRRTAMTEDEVRSAIDDHVHMAHRIAKASDKLIYIYAVKTPEVLGFIELGVEAMSINGLLFEKRRNNVYTAYTFGSLAQRVQYDEFNESILEVYNMLSEEEKQNG